MRNLLEAAAQGGITSAEFTDLKTAYNKISAANAFEKDTPSGSSSDTCKIHNLRCYSYASCKCKMWWSYLTEPS